MGESTLSELGFALSSYIVFAFFPVHMPHDKHFGEVDLFFTDSDKFTFQEGGGAKGPAGAGLLLIFYGGSGEYFSGFENILFLGF